MSNLYIEVGANNGSDSERYIANHPGCTAILFEPTPKLACELRGKFYQNRNVTIEQQAVCETNGTARFNVAGFWDWGCSSLHDFNPNITELWPGRPDFQVSEVLEVQTTRLDTYLNGSNPSNRRYDQDIDYIWIDAQGSDFAALRSLGYWIHSVKAGRCEASKSVELYTNADNRYLDIVRWLQDRGFHCNVTDDAAGGKECNIDFHRITNTCICRITGKQL